MGEGLEEGANLSDLKFQGLIKSWLMGYKFNDSCSLLLVSELKTLKSNLEVWEKEVFNNILCKNGDEF